MHRENKRKAQENGTGSNKKRRISPEEEKEKKIREELERLNSELAMLESAARKVKKTPPARSSRGHTSPGNKTYHAEPDLWDDEDFDDLDVGPSVGGGPRTKRATRPNRYRPQFTEPDDDVESEAAPRRAPKSAKKPVLPAPEWKRILPPSKIPLSQRMVNKKQDPLAYCRQILKDLQKHQFAWVFAKPVDPVALGIPDYFIIIKEPMDLSTVEKRFRQKQYATINDFARDVRLIFDNATTYNQPGTDVHIMAREMANEFEDKFKMAVELDQGGAEMKKQQLRKQQTSLQLEKDKLEKQVQQLQLQKQQQEEKERALGGDVPDMSPPLRPKSEFTPEPVQYADKCQLCNAVNGLQDKYMPGLLKIFREESPNMLKSSNSVVEINTDGLGALILRRLIAYLNDCKTKDQVAVSQAEGRPLPPGTVLPEVPAPGTKKSSSSSSTGSSSSSDSSSDSSDDEGIAKPVLIMPPTLQQLQPPVLSPPLEERGDSKVVVQNMDAWSTLNKTENKPANGFYGQSNGLYQAAGGEMEVEPATSSPGNSPTNTGNGNYLPKTEEGDITAGKAPDSKWADFRNIGALQLQREREMKEQEVAKQLLLKQKQEEEMKLFQQKTLEKQWEEEERVRQEKAEQEQALAQEREAERLRRQQEAGMSSINLMAQNEIMADYERKLRGY